MAYRKIINNFTKGELDPRFLAMVDYDGYHKGCRKFRNAVGIPQGGCQRRFGTNYTDTVVDRNDMDAPITDVEEVRIIPFVYSDDEKYTIVIRPDSGDDGGGGLYVIAFDVYLNQALTTTFYPPVDTFTTAQIREFRWTFREDRIILFHNDVVFHQLIRAASNSWSCVAASLQFYPTYDYTEIDGPANKYTDSGEVFTATGTTGAITFARSAGSSTPFTDNHVGGLIFAETAGVIRITTINSSTSVDGYTLLDLEGVSNRGSEILITEKAWGDGSNNVVLGVARGWPGNGGFFQGRLLAAHWKSKENRWSASQVNQAFNFDDWDDDPSTGYSSTSGGEGNDVIHDIIGYKSIITLGYEGPSASSILLTEPTTPTNVFMTLQDGKRATRIDGKIVDNQVIYVGYNSKSVYSMYFELPDTGYEVNHMSALSDHLITGARWADVFNPSDRDGFYYSLVNEDGTLAVLLLIDEENIKSWSQNYTNGRFIDVACAGDEGHLLVRRKVTTGATVTGDPNYVYSVDSTFNVFTDITAQVSSGTPTTFFASYNDYIVVGSEIEFTRLHLEFSTAANDDCDLLFEYLNSQGTWSTFSPTDGTAGCTGDGDITWSLSDVSNWTQGTLNDVERMYWMRIRRQAPGKINTAYLANSTFTTFDFVDFDFSSTADDVTLFSNDNDYVVIGQPIQFGKIVVDLDTVASADINPVFEYMDSTGAWQTFAPTDGTAGFTSNGTISWTISDLADWTKGTVRGRTDLYWIRIQRDQAALATAPIENQISLNISTSPIVDAGNLNTADRIHLEEIDFDIYMDCQTNVTADGNGDVTGLDHLVGQKVFVYSNSFPIGSYNVEAGGTLSFGAANANYNCEIGIDYKPLIVPMPVDALMQNGHNTYHEQHITDAYVDYYESLGVTVNGQNVIEDNQGAYIYTSAPVPKTDFWIVPVHRGWNPRQEIEISQSYPAPMTLLGIGLTVEVT